MLKKTLLLLCYLIFPLGVSAQTVSGKLIDENSQPLPYANVVLLSLPDSAFVNGTISGEDGTFMLEATSENQIVKISSIGYKTVCKPVSPANIGIVQLVSDAQMLGEVVVKSDLPKTRVKGDAMVTTVAGSILENAGTGNDLLNKIPGVSANEGDIQVFGAGTPEIYINGRKVRDKSELDQLASDNIKSVEVVNNPGSRYDATVNAVIRIQTKKPQGEGFGFNNRFYTGYGYGWNVLDQYNFNYRKGGFDLSGMLYGKKGYTEDRKTITQKTLLDKTWIQDSYLCTQYDMKDISAMLSLNYQFNENHSLGVRYDYDRTPERHETVDPMNTQVYQDDVLYEESHTAGWRNTQETRHTLNAYYNGRVGDWNIDFNADGFWSDTKNPQEMLEQFTPAGGSLEKQTVTTKNLTDNTLYATKLIFGHPLWGGNLSFGGEYTYTNRNNSYINVEGILDDNNSNIKENSTSAFLEYARSFGKLQAQLGVRYEHLSSDYYEDGKYMDEQSRTYDNVFPSVSLNLPIGKVQTQLTYTGSIYRPSYWMLRSDIMYGNRYTYEGGNPLLRPSLINRLTLNVSYKWIYLNSRYIHGEDAITQLSRAYSEDDPTVSLYSFYNMYNSDKLYTTLTLSPTIGLWSPQFNFLLLQQWYKVETSNGTENFNNPIFNFAWNNNFKLPLGISLDVDLGFDTPGDNENTNGKCLQKCLTGTDSHGRMPPFVLYYFYCIIKIKVFAGF